MIRLLMAMSIAAGVSAQQPAITNNAAVTGRSYKTAPGLRIPCGSRASLILRVSVMTSSPR